MQAHLPRVKALHYFATPEHDCSYLPDRTAVTLFADPRARMSVDLYSVLTDYGFRRSGEYVYRPNCPSCNACVPARIPVADFAPRRIQRRIWHKNTDLHVQRRAAGYNAEHFALYKKYVQDRHTGGGMDHADPDKYLSFLSSSWCDTYFYEFRHDTRLLAVAVVDQLRQGLSAVYTFFDAEAAARSLGVYAVLWQVAEARRLNLPWVYLGYWIQGCRKMSYKDQYQPLEILHNATWRRLDAVTTPPS